MTLYGFATNLASAVLIDPAFNDTLITAGISWKSLGDMLDEKIFSIEVPRYLKLVREKGHAVAAYEMRDLSSAIDIMGGTPRVVPSDHDVLVAEYQKHVTNFRVNLLGKELSKSPENYQKIISDFYLRFNHVGSFDAFDGVQSFLPREKLDSEVGRSIVKIPRFEKLSQVIGGFNPGRIGILLGATGLGKTNLMLNLGLAAAEKMGVCYVNMEMSPRDMVRRMAVIRSRIDYGEFFRGGYSPGRIIDQFAPVKGNMAITDGRPLSVQQIKSWAKSRKVKTSLLLIDYDLKVDLPYDRNTPEWKQIQQAIIDLETFAKDEDLYVLMASQINREEQIASSHRAIYSAHTVLKFLEDKEKGFLIVAEKNRHGKKRAAVVVNYSEENSSIDEAYDITYTPTPNKKPTPIPGINQPYKD